MTFPEPVISVAIEPKTKATRTRWARRSPLSDEDPTFRVHTDAETGQTIISGMGELHLEIIVDRMLREFKVDANVGRPQVAYRETIRKPVENVEAKFVRQTGGRGQYGHVVINIEPGEPGSGLRLRGQDRRRRDPPRVHQARLGGDARGDGHGCAGRLPDGGRQGAADLRVYHDVDSSEMAFKIAGSMALKEACPPANPVLLEPMMDVEVVTPADYMGDVMGDLSSRRGKIQGMEQRGDAQVINAIVPLSEMFGYSTTLRSMSQGRAVYSMQFKHYEEVPKSKAEEIIAKVRG
jgi:elongation factor G